MAKGLIAAILLVYEGIISKPYRPQRYGMSYKEYNGY